jgi:hypothetical protein
MMKNDENYDENYVLIWKYDNTITSSGSFSLIGWITIFSINYLILKS